MEISAMPGLAMESSAKGLSDSTTTARFIGTDSGVETDPLITRSTSARANGAATTVAASPRRPALTIVPIIG
ncbi:hypothetical protein GCM10011341_19480 [Frigidibacter albus]|nr:hypothetical protein GCM10011341_19480 [Frigidibacter albus]